MIIFLSSDEKIKLYITARKMKNKCNFLRICCEYFVSLREARSCGSGNFFKSIAWMGLAKKNKH